MKNAAIQKKVFDFVEILFSVFTSMQFFLRNEKNTTNAELYRNITDMSALRKVMLAKSTFSRIQLSQQSSEGRSEEPLRLSQYPLFICFCNKHRVSKLTT